MDESRPARGEWIEIPSALRVSRPLKRLAPHGASGLKWNMAENPLRPERLAPHGASGLKYR